MRVMVTGGAGFIGTQLAQSFVELGHEVDLVDDLSRGSRAAVAHLGKGVTLWEMDVNSGSFVDLASSRRPEVIFHLAANSDIAAGIEDSSVDFDRTLASSRAVCEGARSAGSREVLFASSSAVFGQRPGALLEDDGPMRPISFYGAAKLASEAWFHAFSHLSGVQVRVLRLCNIVGPGLTHGILFDFARKLSKDPSRLQVLGNGHQRKPYLFTDDLIAAILILVEWQSTDPYAVFHVGPDGDTDVRAIAESMVNAWGTTTQIVYQNSAHGWPGDVPKFALDSTKLRSLGWAPSRTSTEAIQLAIGQLVAERRR